MLLACTEWMRWPKNCILRDRLASSIRACEISMDSIKFINVTEIYNLGKGVNTHFDDYFPFLTNNQRKPLLYATARMMAMKTSTSVISATASGAMRKRCAASIRTHRKA